MDTEGSRGRSISSRQAPGQVSVCFQLVDDRSGALGLQEGLGLGTTAACLLPAITTIGGVHSEARQREGRRPNGLT